MRSWIALVVAGMVCVSVAYADTFSLRHDKTGKTYGPFEYENGAKVLLGNTRFTVTDIGADTKSSLPESKNETVKAAPKGGLTGKFNGKPWTGRYAYFSMFNKEDADEYKIEVCSEKEPDKYKRMSLSHLSIKLPKKPGVYKLGPMFNMTFYTPPGNNVMAYKGSMTVEKKGDVYNVKLAVRSDDDNDLRGSFVFSPSSDTSSKQEKTKSNPLPPRPVSRDKKEKHSLNSENLIRNPSNEMPMKSGKIPEWEMFTGKTWDARKENPAPKDGAAYFFPGATEHAELRQNVSVSRYRSKIMMGRQAFRFEGYVSSWQNALDSSRIVIEYLDMSKKRVLDSFDSNEHKSAMKWEKVMHEQLAPKGTYYIRIRLISKRYNGNNNDGYFDDLSLKPIRQK